MLFICGDVSEKWADDGGISCTHSDRIRRVLAEARLAKGPLFMRPEVDFSKGWSQVSPFEVS
jgi:hypothetical protein